MKRVLLIAAILVGLTVTTVVCDSKRPEYTVPKAEELIAQMRLEVIEMTLDVLKRASDLAKIEQAMNLPCATVTVSSNTVRGNVYYGLETDLSGCIDGAIK